jgi:hypothetical protein
MMSLQPFHLKQYMTHTLPHHETECQRSVNTIWSCMLGNQRFVQIYELITKLMSAFITKDIMYKMKKDRFQNNKYRGLQNMQKEIIGYRIPHWNNILLSNCKNKNII